MGNMEIVDFHPDHAGAFKALNEAWISRYFTIEAKDREVLDDPAGKILAPGGHILMAVEHGAPIGCVALLAMPSGGFEVAKMAVTEAHKGRGIGRDLMAACIAWARAAGADRLYLETNSGLAPALGLYHSFGFCQIEPAEPSPYVRADVAMELRL
jgi:putative acetyltransferase